VGVRQPETRHAKSADISIAGVPGEWRLYAVAR